VHEREDLLRGRHGLGLVHGVARDRADAERHEDHDEQHGHEVAELDPALAEEEAADVVLEGRAEEDRRRGDARAQAARDALADGLLLRQREELVELGRHGGLDAVGADRAHVEHGLGRDAARARERLVRRLGDLGHVGRRDRDGRDDHGDDRQRDEREAPRRVEAQREAAQHDDEHRHGERDALADERAHGRAVLGEARRERAGGRRRRVVPADGLADHRLERRRADVADDALGDPREPVGLEELADGAAAAHGDEHQRPELGLAAHVAPVRVEEGRDELGHEEPDQRLRRAADARAQAAQARPAPVAVGDGPEPADDGRRGHVVLRGVLRRDLGIALLLGLDGHGHDDVLGGGVLRQRLRRRRPVHARGVVELRLDQSVVLAARVHERLVRALLGDGAVGEDGDLVRAAHRGQAVGDDERRPLLGRDDVVDGPLDDALRLGVERGRRLVEHEDLRVADERARDGHALLLAARELDAAVADLRLEAVRERAHEVERVRQFRGALDVRAARARAAVGDVVGDGAAEEHGLLGDEADLRAERGDVPGPRVDAVDEERAAVDVVEAEQQGHGRGLAAARRAHQRAGLARVDGQGQAGVDGPVRARRVRERHSGERDGAAGDGARGRRRLPGLGFRVRRVGLGRDLGVVDDLEDLARLGRRERERGDAGERLEQREAPEQHAQKRRHDVAARDAVVGRLADVAVLHDPVVALVAVRHVRPDEVRPVPEPERPRAVEDGRDQRAVEARGHGGAQGLLGGLGALGAVLVGLDLLRAERRDGADVRQRLHGGRGRLRGRRRRAVVRLLLPGRRRAEEGDDDRQRADGHERQRPRVVERHRHPEDEGEDALEARRELLA